MQNQTKAKGIDRVLEVLSLINGDVRNLVPITEMGQPMIYVDVGRSRLLPLSVLGAGFFHLLRLALAISEIERGIIIVDELEDGLHHTLFSKLFRIVLDAIGSKKDLQFFIATHSGELIKAAIETSGENRFRDICLINMLPSPNGGTAQAYDEDEVNYAMSLDAELR